MTKKVFVSGCFDVFHTGHLAFLKTAAEYGDLYVSVAQDSTIVSLKGKSPAFSQEERLAIIKELSCVKDAFIAQGAGMLDFESELTTMKPDLFVVNKDGDCESKRDLCSLLGITYLVLEREPLHGFPERSSTELKKTIEKWARD